MLGSCLILSDGSRGMENQSIALAKLLKLNFKVLIIKPNYILRLFPSFAYYFHFFFCKSLPFLKTMKPDFIITTGKRMSGYSILVKKILSNKIINIHIQNPRTYSSFFDLLILPKHDNVKGNNIIFSIGSLSFFDENDINMNYKLVKKNPFTSNKPTVFLLLGGKNKRYNPSYSDFCRFLIEVKKSVLKIRANLIISTSRRTTKKVSKIIEILFKSFENNFFLINEQDKFYYPGMLKKTNFVIVTSDSINMISEISHTKIPLFIGYLKKEKGKIYDFHKSLEKHNYSKTFKGKLFFYKKNVFEFNQILKKNVMEHIKNLSKQD